MKVELKDIPGEEALIEVPPGELVVNYNKLVPFREKFTAEEIISFIVDHELFKVDSWEDLPKLGFNTLKGDGLRFCHAIKSLLVTWDARALEHYEKLFSYKPGGFVIEYISYALVDCAFPKVKAMKNFVHKIQEKSPKIAKYFDPVKETYEHYLKVGDAYTKKQREFAKPAEEFRGGN